MKIANIYYEYRPRKIYPLIFLKCNPLILFRQASQKLIKGTGSGLARLGKGSAQVWDKTYRAIEVYTWFGLGCKVLGSSWFDILFLFSFCSKVSKFKVSFKFLH